MSEKGNKSNLMQYMSNPRTFTIKKWFNDLLGADSLKHDSAIERAASSVQTQSDMESFGKLTMEIYQAGYKKGLLDCQEQLDKAGVKVKFSSDVIKSS